MKGIKCLIFRNSVLGLVFFGAFLLFGFLLSSSDVYAVDYGYSGNVGYTSATIYTNATSYTMLNDPTTWSGTVSGSERITSIRLCPSSTIPANSIATISFYHISNDNFVPLLLSQGSSSYSVLGNTSGEYGRSTASLFFDSNIDSCFYLYTNSNYLSNHSRLDITPISLVVLEDEPSAALLTAIESNLANRLSTLHSDMSNVSTQLDELKGLVENSVDTAEEQKQKDDEDRDNLESQSSQAEGDADSSQEDAESTGTTLLVAFTSFVGALTSVRPTNCNLDMDLGNLDLGVVNLCQLSPPSGFSAIASVFLILFCVPLSIATARKVISLFRSFQ